MSTIDHRREAIFSVVATHDWDGLRTLLRRMSPENDGENYYVALVHLQFAEWSAGNLSAAARVLRTVLRRSRDEYVLSVAYVQLGEIYELCGYFAQAESFFAKSLDYSYHRGLRANAKNCLGLLAFNLGLFELSRRHYSAANDAADPMFVTIFSKIGMARCELRIGDLSRAESYLEASARAIDHYVTHQSVDQEVMYRVARAEFAARTGAIDESIGHFDAAEYRAVAGDRPRQELRVHEARATLLVELDHPRAGQALHRFRERAMDSIFRQYGDRVRRLEAELARHRGADTPTLRQLCGRVRDPGQRFIAFARLLRDDAMTPFELQRLGSLMSTEVLEQMWATHLAT